MVPSLKWFPQSVQERPAWLQNFMRNLTPVAPMLGVTPPELAALGLDVEDFQSVAATTLAVENFKNCGAPIPALVLRGRDDFGFWIWILDFIRRLSLRYFFGSTERLSLSAHRWAEPRSELRNSGVIMRFDDNELRFRGADQIFR